MEQGKKKLISGADDFVEARKAQLEKDKQQQDKQQQEKGAQDEEFHKTQAQQNEQFLKNEQHMIAERARLHNEQQQRLEQHNAQQQVQVKFLPPENQFGDYTDEHRQKNGLPPANAALQENYTRGKFAENQMQANIDSRREFEAASETGETLTIGAIRPEDVAPMPGMQHMSREGTTSAPQQPQQQAEPEKSQSQGRSM